jgi:anti-sigma factor (TIGR02949 family)
MTNPDRLTCEETFRRLDDFLDRELSEEEAHQVGGHLEDCARCATRFQFEAEVISAVREKLRRIQAPPDLRDRIAARLAEADEQGTGKKP